MITFLKIELNFLFNFSFYYRMSLEQQIRDDLHLDDHGDDHDNDQEMDDDEVLLELESNQSVDTTTIKHVSFGNHPWDSTWEDNNVTVNYAQVEGFDLLEVTEIILGEIRSTTPKRISVSCYGKFLGEHECEEVHEQMKLLVAAVQKNPQHKLLLCHTMFIPAQEHLWTAQTRLNFDIRSLNIIMKRPLLPLHKLGLTSQPATKELGVKKSCFVEAAANEGLGSNFTSETLEKIKSWILKYHSSGFGENMPIGVKMTQSDMRPRPLQFTVGYRNQQMTQRIKQLGTYTEPATPKNGAKTAVKPSRAKRREFPQKPAGILPRPPIQQRTNSAQQRLRQSRFSLNRLDSRRNSSGGASDSVFMNNHESRWPDRTTRQLEMELENLRVSKDRMEVETERRMGRERDRCERLDHALERARAELVSINDRYTELKRENSSLRMELERSQNNSAEAWQIIKMEWRRRDEENAKNRKQKKD